MNSSQIPILSITALIIVGLIVFQTVRVKSEKKEDSMDHSGSQVISSSPTASSSPTSFPSSSPTPTKSPSPKTTASINSNSSSSSDFTYPNAKIISQNGGSLTLESNDGSKIITDWYRKKITNLGMKATSFIQTSTNDNVLNKLVGGDGSREVKVEISKAASESKVTIKVN